jgi:predicted transposase YbfD/YdcC
VPMRQTKAQVEEQALTESIVEHFAAVEDPRREHGRLHSLTDILVISLCAVISGADSFAEIELFATTKEKWLKTFIDLENGIPSHDTLARVFSILDPEALGTAFRRWVTELATLSAGEVVAIDGKSLRRSFRTAGSNSFVHMVSAWATSNRVVLGQVKTEEKSNEITAIPRLLKLLKIKDCMVTIDAMGCQKEIAKEIVDAEADYLLAVKDNQQSLSDNVRSIFDHVLLEPTKHNISYHETREKGHGRKEVRRCWTTDLVEGIPNHSDWSNLESIVMIEAERTVAGKTSSERRYYISSKKGFSATKALHAVRSHWGIENELHWVLDVVFREDDCRVRAGCAAQNFSVIRQLSLNLLKSVPNAKGGIKSRRLRCALDQDFLLQVLTSNPGGK